MNEDVREPIDESDWWRAGSIDLGHAHHAKPLRHEGAEIGFLIRHLKPSGEDCWGTVYYTHPEPEKHPIWTLKSREPLTLSPSILCSCGDHGFIREGKWVPA